MRIPTWTAALQAGHGVHKHPLPQMLHDWMKPWYSAPQPGDEQMNLPTSGTGLLQ
jgi:hypothetical protein